MHTPLITAEQLLSQLRSTHEAEHSTLHLPNTNDDHAVLRPYTPEELERHHYDQLRAQAEEVARRAATTAWLEQRRKTAAVELSEVVFMDEYREQRAPTQSADETAASLRHASQ